MTDKCFLCLSNTRLKMCHQCNLVAHRKCWKQYIDNKNKDLIYKSCVECPQCKVSITFGHKMTTRSMSGFKKTRHVADTIKLFIHKIQRTNGSQNLKLIHIQMFEFMLENMFFIHSHPRFELTVKNKLIEYSTVDNWDYAGYVYEKMFGEPI